MQLLATSSILLAFAHLCKAHGNHHSDESSFNPVDFADEEASLEDIWGGFWPYQGVETFAHLPHTECLIDDQETFDIGIIGVPFDTATSYRPGARFGPSGIRKASQRQDMWRGFNFRAGLNPFDDWAKIIDCGDIPVTPMDNALALKQMSAAYDELVLKRNSTFEYSQSGSQKTSPTRVPPRFVSLGGDHSILLPILRTLKKAYGEVYVVHFDSHLDTWAPDKYPSYWKSEASDFTHGSMLWLAQQEGLIAKNGNLHVGLRTRISGDSWDDFDEDDEVGFKRIFADEIIDLQATGMARKILDYLPHDKPIYVSVDIDVIDPSAAPGTGTMEVGGFMTRELIYMLRQMETLNIVGADIVEVAPAYDPLDITQLAGSQVAYELITSMVKKGPLDTSLLADPATVATDEVDIIDKLINDESRIANMRMPFL
ncbi:Guanidinobutyrase [Hanseniaspora osmophila]